MRAFSHCFNILKGLVAGALMLCLVAAPIQAQESAESLIAAADKAEERADTDGLKQWFDNLSPDKRQALQRRARALRALPKDQQEAIFGALKGDKDVFTPEQTETLKKIAGLSPLQRVRLHGLRMELERIRKDQPDFFKGLETMPKAERVSALARKLGQVRASKFIAGLDEKTREELKGLPEGERMRRGRELFMQATKARLEELAKNQPQLAELRQKAEAGDKEARRKLTQAMRDLATLDKLIERIEEPKRAEIRAKVSAMPMDDAVKLVKDELKDQIGKSHKREGPREPKDGKDGKDGDLPRHRPLRDEFRDRGERKRDK